MGADQAIRIGYTLSATGPYSVGAGITQGTGYALWLDQVNAKGGLAVKDGGRRPIEYVTIDDRSEIETAVRYYEKLMGDDKVDLILPPWGTAMNFAVAPIANKYGYPMIGPTVSSNKLKELSFPYFYAILQQPDACMGAFTAFLRDLKGQGKVSKIGVAYVNDLFGIEMHASLTTALKDTGLDVVDTKSYPLGVKDLSPVLKGFKVAGVDVFLGLTYPPDNMLAASQAKEVDFNPPVYLSAVGTAFPFYRDRFKGAEGVSGIAGWNPKMKYAGAREYYDATWPSIRRTRPLGQRLRLCLAADPGALRGRGGARPEADQGDDRRDGVPDGGRPHQVREGRQCQHAGNGRPVAEGGVRDRVAEEPGHRHPADTKAGVGLTLLPSPPSGERGRVRGRTRMRVRE
jgi:ABC-type branched-subunit amino acid transport system substrate-binding protein